ncbi:MAG: flavin-dependent oxidoreductase, partial [Pseudomonadota bacterium]
YNRCLHVYPGFGDAPGYRTIKTIKTGALSQYTVANRQLDQLTWGNLLEDRHVIAGSPETVREQMEELIKSLKVGNIFCLMQIGNMPKEKCMHSTRLFAEKVMPHLQNMWPDYADDNRFWCQPLSQSAQPAPIRETGPDIAIAAGAGGA